MPVLRSRGRMRAAARHGHIHALFGMGVERTKNLGHDSTVDKLVENPVRRPLDYEGGPARHIIDERRSVGVYRKFADPQGGVSSVQNLRGWQDYAGSNSWHGKDPKGRGEGSDGHLASTKNWAGFEYGSESGLGRLEKAGKR